MIEHRSRVAFSRSMPVDFPPERVFPLMCPVLEEDWIEGWKATVHHTRSGVAEMGCVFSTDLPGKGREVWMVTRYEAPSRIEFSRIAGTTRACHLEVLVEATSEDGSMVTFTYTYTAIDDEGDRWVERYRPEQFAREMDALQARLVHYLETGEALVASHA